MPRAQRKILVADTAEDLEEQLRRIAVAGASQPPKKPGEEDDDDPVPAPDDEPDEDGDGDDDDTIPVPPAEAPAEPAQTHAVPQVQRYESRIHIVEAWQYPGSLKNHPDFVDPSWTAWAEYDETTKQESGPALRVPTGRLAQDKLARKGDYVVRQLVTIDPTITPEVSVDVWAARDFERLFIPAHRH